MIVAAFNEEATIERTLEHIAGSAHGGPVEVVPADNGSTDGTAAVTAATARRLSLDYRRSFEPAPGKHRALNTALTT